VQVELDGETALVTGAASGLGREIAVQLAAAGARLCLVDLDGAGAEKALADIGVPGQAYACDVSDPGAVEELLAVVAADFGPVDILVNNAGIPGVGGPKPMHETTVDEWQRVMAVNATGPFLFLRGLIPSMLERRHGVIVNIVSIGGFRAGPQRAPYIASKAALLNLTRQIAAEYAASGIRGNAVCPGWIDTPMTHWRLEQPELRAQAERHIPAGRVAEVGDIAGTVVFLASKAARYMNGSALVVDGGMTV
jgi:NAD(P)-dependent dehydrogenase (short-subunit alcohol dehydrogenase family)